MKTNMLRNAFALVMCGLILISLTGSAAAATASKTPVKAAPPATVNNTNTLKVSPVRTDVTIEAGQTETVKTQITNLTKTPIAVQPIENDFVAGDESGTPSIVLDENAYAPTHSLKRFMVPLANVTVPAGETKDVLVTITVPKSAQAGGYYGAIRYAPVTVDSSKNVNLSTSVASLILLTVPGPTLEKLSMTNFDVQQNGTTATNFRNPDDLTILLRFQNDGNIQQAPFGQVYVRQKNKVLYTYSFNQESPKANILPDSARRWTIPLKNLGKFGKYEVGATFTYGTKNETIEVKKTVWIIPTSYLLIGGGSILGFILLIVLIIVGLRAYKRRILAGPGRYRRR